MLESHSHLLLTEGNSMTITSLLEGQLHNLSAKTAGNKRNSVWFCDHCKMLGHVIDRCYKLHGYPQNWPSGKDKKMAHLVQGSIEDGAIVADTTTNTTTVAPTITLEQYNHLLTLLNKSATDPSPEVAAQSQNAATAQGVLSGNQALFSGHKFCLISMLKSIWVLDSGATDHICHNFFLKKFDSYYAMTDKDTTITIPDGRKVPILHVGTVKFTNSIILKDVFHVPEFHFNLISVHRLCDNMNCEVVFSSNTCFIQGPNMTQPQVLGKIQQGLYCADGFLQSGDVSNENNTIFGGVSAHHTDADAIKLWHLRLGHLPFPKLHLVQDHLHIPKSFDCYCQVCLAARQTRSSFPLSTSKTLQPFELIHVDIWGPYKVATYNKCTMFLTAVDDYSRTTWVHFLKNKSGVVIVMKDFISYAFTQFHASVKCVRSDNAKELTEGDLLLFYNSKGIVVQKSCTDTPQQNEVVQRKHRYLLETARGLYIQSKVPPFLWGECILTAAHIINRLPLSVLNNVSPYEMLMGTKPSVAHFKVFGCLCFMSTLKQGRSKFDPRAHPCVFIGYPPHQKAYKVYNLVTHKIHVTRDLVFHGIFPVIFPFHQLLHLPPFFLFFFLLLLLHNLFMILTFLMYSKPLSFLLFLLTLTMVLLLFPLIHLFLPLLILLLTQL
ncbi:Retrovirus-related Pol polyprotein from transposon TNT 1-94 [Bienertia sinuspersici]